MVDNNPYQEERRKKYASVAENLKGTIAENGGQYDSERHNPSFKQSSNCPQCSYPVSDNMNVCPNCGKVLKEKKEEHTNPYRQKSRTCKKCGNEVAFTAKFCPICGTPLQMETINIWEKPQQGEFCTLKPLSWKGEDMQYSPISYSGSIIYLNRSNTDPNNNTITSKEQAVLTREGNAWYIEDRSEQHTTLLRVSRKTKLENGDIIVLGNRLFEFKG